MKITIIDCGSGNLRSAQKAFEKASDDLFKKNNVIISSKIEDIENSNCVVLPGGVFGDGVGGAVRKEDTEILEMWNAAIAEMSKDGTTAEITKVWFGRDISM